MFVCSGDAEGADVVLHEHQGGGQRGVVRGGLTRSARRARRPRGSRLIYLYILDQNLAPPTHRFIIFMLIILTDARDVVKYLLNCSYLPRS